MQKTLGGDRLGSGKKMQVNMHGYERSTHDPGYIWRSTMSPGTLVPFLKEVGLPGDTFDINLDIDIKTHPTIGPLFGSYKVQADLFLCPFRLYQGALHNNALNIGRNMSQIKLPQIELTAIGFTADEMDDLDNCQINPSSLPAHLGIRGIGRTTTNQIRQFNAVPILAYWEIYKNYYANKQEEIGAVLHTPSLANITTVTTITVSAILGGAPVVLQAHPIVGTTPLWNGAVIKINYTGATPKPEQIIIRTTNNGDMPATLAALAWSDQGTHLEGSWNWPAFGNQTGENWRYITNTDINNGKPAVVTFPLENIDTMRNEILSKDLSTPLVLNNVVLEPYRWLYEHSNTVPNLLSSQEGLALKTYQSDMLNNWLSTEWIDGAGGISELTAIDTSGGTFTIDTLVLARKVYNMLNRIAVSGGSYDDWLDAVWAHDRYQRCESPMYMGGLIKELIFQEVVSNSQGEGDGGEQPLGTLAGKGVMAKKHKGGNVVIHVDEPSYIIGIISLTPRLDYSQGNKWDVNLKTMDDLHKPALDEIGFQELITEKMAWWDTHWDGADWVQKSAGKQPAWLDYMTNVNQVRGNFAIPNNEMFMVLNRRYELDEAGTSIGDLTTYIDPSKFNHIFAQTSLDAQNFWAQIAVDMTSRRKMSAKLMPNL